ncbi:hypothetical protein L249_1585 [Ophiocordyceps polyrhachis-furcata BCC 54312]|uniref:N-acetylglucosaminylphosphatidylinositol deacetylase n=1 Tax=Ophiocordyceps polyrhachis-furcata BCC 54312 TaxID=1330021 RepID=A0A367KZD4_9HYPO|nr:hypothetical protein L249_1585 [Ophiocordyceps polyrhachis-furcata BCC 54312]
MALWLYLSAIATGILALVLTLSTTKTISSILAGQRHQQPQLRNRRICLLIAHPDDEAMFFAPTVLALSRPETGNHVKILCLSTGDARGLGSVRRTELVRSGVLLGLRGEDDVFVVDDPTNFPDSMTKTWPTDRIASLLASAFTSKPSSKPTIDVLITFDRAGVSSHPNHISLYHGAKAFVNGLASDEEVVVDLYALSSVNVLRKYISVFDLFLSVFFSERAVSAGVGVGASQEVKREMEEVDHHPSSLVFVSDWSGFIAARRAMMHAHRSQMVWFRHLYILFSRYMVINDLRLEKSR